MKQAFAFCSEWDACCVPRLGLRQLVQMSVAGVNLADVWKELMEKATDDASDAGLGMDLSAIAQLRSDKDLGLAIQRDMLRLHQVFRIGSGAKPARLRVLAFAAAADIGSNMPIDFLLEGSNIELATCYVSKGVPFPALIPDHDVAIVIAPVTADGEEALAAVDALLPDWPRPVLNRPEGIRNLERDRLYRALSGIDGLQIPRTSRVSREALEAIARRANLLAELLPDTDFPIIVRPLGSHAGAGLSKIDLPEELELYLAEQPEADFFISRYIDFSGGDGLFRKYRLALIGGRPFASHMAISDEWKVWYASADMAVNVANRMEEAVFMQFFEEDFAVRHGKALAEVSHRLDLDYFAIDCAETRGGELLIFEADNTAIVHDLDPPNVFPYKHEHMLKIFAAFADMLCARAAPRERRSA